jgi:tetratricopeptide (TPR) repeat protein
MDLQQLLPHIRPNDTNARAALKAREKILYSSPYAIETRGWPVGDENLSMTNFVSKYEILVVILDENLLSPSLEDTFSAFGRCIKPTEGQCLYYLDLCKAEQIILIICNYTSETLNKQWPFLTKLQSLEQIVSTFIYQPENKLPKTAVSYDTYVIDVYNDKQQLKQAVEQTIERILSQTITFSFYFLDIKCIRCSTFEEFCFLWYLLYKPVLFSLEDKHFYSKQQMLYYCKKYYSKDEIELTQIALFEQTYQPSDAIKWYLKKNFLYKLLGRAFRIRIIEILNLLHSYIQDLSLCITQNFQQQQHKKTDIKTKYHCISIVNKSDAMKWRCYANNLTIAHGFWLLNKGPYLPKEEQNKKLKKKATTTSNLTNKLIIIINIEIDLSLNAMEYADVTEYLLSPTILVNLGAVFMIKKVTEEQTYLSIELISDNSGQKLTTDWIEYHRTVYDESNLSFMFGNLQLDVDKVGALKYYEDLLLINDNDIGNIFYGIGVTYGLNQEYQQAYNNLERAYEIQISMNSPSQLCHAATTCAAIGDKYLFENDKEKTLEYHKKALCMREMCYQSAHPNLASSYKKIGRIYELLYEDYDQAKIHYLKALEIEEKCPQIHYCGIAECHEYLGDIHNKLDKNDGSSQKYYEEACNMYSKLLHIAHPSYMRCVCKIYMK